MAQAMKELVFVVIFMGILFTILGVFIYFVWRHIQQRLAKTTACFSGAAERLGLKYAEGGTDENALISGTLEGHAVKVGMTLHAKQSARDVHRKLYRAGTKVDVSTASELEFVFSPGKEQASQIPEGWVEQENTSGDFRLWHPADSEVTLPPELKTALGECSIPLTVQEGNVSWWHSSVEKNPERLEKNVRTCVALAKVLEPS